MAKTVGGRIILDEEESKRLWQDILHPDLEAIKERDAFIEDTKNWTVIELEDGSSIIEISDLNIPMLHNSSDKEGSDSKPIENNVPQSDSKKLNKFRIFKPSGIVDVILVRHKGTQEYSFVNLTKGHICPCRFKTFEDAVADIEDRMKDGKILSYQILEREE